MVNSSATLETTVEDEAASSASNLSELLQPLIADPAVHVNKQPEGVYIGPYGEGAFDGVIINYNTHMIDREGNPIRLAHSPGRYDSETYKRIDDRLMKGLPYELPQPEVIEQEVKRKSPILSFANKAVNVLIAYL